jgi:hypothetical protein
MAVHDVRHRHTQFARDGHRQQIGTVDLSTVANIATARYWQPDSHDD